MSSKLIRYAIVAGCVCVVGVFMYSDMRYRNAVCPDETIKVRLYDGGVGCFTGLIKKF